MKRPRRDIESMTDQEILEAVGDIRATYIGTKEMCPDSYSEEDCIMSAIGNTYDTWAPIYGNDFVRGAIGDME
jgi:hypothetical protein